MAKDHAYYYIKKQNAAKYFGVNEEVYSKLASLDIEPQKCAIRCNCKKGKDHFSKDWSFI